MLIHEPLSPQRSDRRWIEGSTFGILVSLIALVVLALTAIPNGQPLADSFVVESEQVAKEAFVVDPNWEPTQEIVFRARYERSVPPRMRDKEGFVCVLGAHGFHVIDVVEGRLGVDWLFFSPPEGVVSGGLYTLRWKPSLTAKSDLKAAYRNRQKTYHMWFWENPKLVEQKTKTH